MNSIKFGFQNFCIKLKSKKCFKHKCSNSWDGADLNPENRFVTETAFNTKTIGFQNCSFLLTPISFIFNEKTNEMMDFQRALQLENEQFGLNIKLCWIILSQVHSWRYFSQKHLVIFLATNYNPPPPLLLLLPLIHLFIGYFIWQTFLV